MPPAPHVPRRPVRGVPAGLVGAAAVLLTLAGVLLWLEVAARPWRLASGLQEAAGHLQRGQARLAAGRLRKAASEIVEAEAAARRAAGANDAPSPLLDVAELVGAARRARGELDPIVRAVEHSVAAARGTLEIARGALRGETSLIASGEDGARVRLERVEALAEDVGRVRERLAATRRSLDEVRPRRLPRRLRPRLDRALAEARRGDAALADLERGLELLPGILGADGPRWYLIGMQNNGELRGTGGALLRFALLEIDRGVPKLRRSGTVYDVDVERETIDIPLPDDAWYVRAIEDAQRFGNANWSPDWPLSAQLTVAYGHASRGTGSRPLPPIAGVIAADPRAMAELMPGLGPYRISDGRALKRSNVERYLLQRAYGVHPGRGPRRVVLIDVVEGFYESLLDPKSPSRLLQGFGDSLATKHLQLWLAHRAEQRFVERMDWDGGVEPAPRRDYVYVVQQNVGGNKLNYAERQEHSVDVRIRGRDALVSTAVDVTNMVVQPQPGYWVGNSEGAHRPMLNLYVPERARLLDARVRGTLLPTPAPAVWFDGRPPEHFEKGKKVWSATLEVLPARSGRVRFDYRVPDVVRAVGDRRVYRLVVQHQPKVRPERLTVTVRLPAGARAVHAQGWRRRGSRLVWDRPLDEDVELEVSWRA